MKIKMFFHVLVACIMVLNFFTFNPMTAQANIYGDFEYHISGGSVEIIKYNGNASELIIPSSIENLPVTKINTGAFHKNQSLVHVTIPNGVTTIDNWVFMDCYKLESVTIPSSVTYIGNRAFEWLFRLSVVKFEHMDGSLIRFGDESFHGFNYDFRIEYPSNAVGFSSPVWNGYPARPSGSAAAPQKPANANLVASPMNKKLLVIVFNPILHNRGGVRYLEYTKDSPTNITVENIVKRLNIASHGIINYEISYEVVDEFPQMKNGTAMSIESFADVYDASGRDGVWKLNEKTSLDYWYYFNKWNIVERRNNGEFDEIWIDSGLVDMGYETIMIGKGAYFINGAHYDADCPPFRVAGMQTSGATALENLGHSAEAIMSKVTGSYDWYASISEEQKTNWHRFVQIDKHTPGNAAVGNVHYAPNSVGDYDWGNEQKVLSTWRDWRDNYPNLTGEKESSNTSDWGNGDNLNHKTWWFSCFPHVTGRDEKGYSNNWWEYYQNLVHTENLDIRISESSSNAIQVDGMPNRHFQIFATLNSGNVIDVTFDAAIQQTKDNNGATRITVWRDGVMADSIINGDSIVNESGSSTQSGNITMTIDNPIMSVNGQATEIDPGRGTVPIIINGRTMIPIRAVAEAMGGNADWDEASQGITVNANGKKVQMWIGRKDILVNGVSAAMDTVPIIQNGRTLLPLRFVAENIGCEVEWIGEQRRIIITY